MNEDEEAPSNNLRRSKRDLGRIDYHQVQHGRPRRNPNIACLALAEVEYHIPMLTFNQKEYYLAVALTQLTMREGIKQHGDKVTEAIIKEWRQLYDLEVLIGQHYDELTPQERKNALHVVMGIKEK